MAGGGEHVRRVQVREVTGFRDKLGSDLDLSTTRSNSASGTRCCTHACPVSNGGELKGKRGITVVVSSGAHFSPANEKTRRFSLTPFSSSVADELIPAASALVCAPAIARQLHGGRAVTRLERAA